jgi:hypothetical protein
MTHASFVAALCERHVEAALAEASPRVRVFAPVDEVASYGVVDGRGPAMLRAALEALWAYSGGPLHVLAAAHADGFSVLELATPPPQRDPVTAVIRWDEHRVLELRLYFDPPEREAVQ